MAIVLLFYNAVFSMITYYAELSVVGVFTASFFSMMTHVDEHTEAFFLIVLSPVF